MANILQRLGAFRNKAIAHPIDTDTGPVEFKFYPPRMRMLLSGRLREIIDPISSAVAALFDDRSADASRQQEVAEGGTVTTFVQALNPDVIQLRQKQKEEAISKAMKALLADNTRYQIGELLADSLREEFSENEAQRAQEARQFMDELDLPTLLQFLKGYFKALAPILNPSGKSILSGLPEMVKREVGKALGKTQAGESTSPEVDGPTIGIIPHPSVPAEPGTTMET
jgi:hypothetical protein